ncbi:MAG TPA: hypothetical protein VMT88_04520 [Actinomycetes bacterium]|nr:hypothetical protein [Actinomycetes bacterium]
MKRVAALALASVASVALSTAIAVPALAAPVPLDDSFSGDGTAVLKGNGFEYNYGVTADGDAVYAYGGAAANWNKYSKHQVVERYLPNGRLDPNFSGDGVKTLQYTKSSAAIDGAMTADGRLLVAGWTQNGLTVTQLKSNGALDKSFADHGTKRIAVKQAASAPQVEVLSTGQIVVTWTRITNWKPRTSDLQFTRLRPNGSTISSFGHGGVRTVDIWRNDQLDDMAVAADDRVYVAAWSASGKQPRGLVSVVSLSPKDRVWVKKFNEYGSHGTYTAGINVDASNNALVGITPFNAPGVGVLKVTSDGSLDHSYSGDGVAKADCTCYTTDSVLTAGGVVVLGGSSNGSKVNGIRFTNTGAFDTAFSGGQANWDLFPGGEFPGAASVDASGRLLLVGNYGGKTGNAYVARVLVP